MHFAVLTASFILLDMLHGVASHLDGRKIGEHDREHLREHYQGELDLSKMTDEEIRFLYFQSHDAESNDKLDGTELVQSLLHFHAEESHFHGRPSKVFTDAELSVMVDSLMDAADKNVDGYIDYPEFVAGQSVQGKSQILSTS